MGSKTKKDPNKKNSAVGLDIGDDTVKLIELKRHKGAVMLSRADYAQIASGGGTAPGRREFKRAVAELLAKNQLKPKEVVLGINGQSVIVKFIDVLPVSGE